MSTTETVEQRADRLIRQEVLCCLSSIVSTLAQGYGEVQGRGDLPGLSEQAFELASPVPDYEDAAREAGWITADMTPGMLINPTHTDDETGAAADFEGSWQDLCEAHDIEPYDREVYEHWAVTDWFGRKLKDAGEKVDDDFGNLVVWARTTTGQAISMDGVVQRIAAELLRD